MGDTNLPPPRAIVRHRLILGAVLLAGLLARVAWAFSQPADPAELARRLPDQGEYLQLATNLLHGRGLVLHDDRFGQDVYAYRTPGYPLVVAALGANVRAVRFVQAVLDVSVALAAYLIARRVLSASRSYPQEAGAGSPRSLSGETWAPLVAAALVASNPYLIYFSALILSETLFTVLLAWATACLLSNRRRLPLVGVYLLIAAVYVRPSAAGLAPLLVGVAAWANSPGVAAYRRGAAAVVAAVATVALLVVVLVPWATRNERRLGQRVWLTSNGGITAYDGFNPAATGASDQAFVQQMPELRRMGELDRDRYLSGLAGDYAHDHPGRVVSLAVAKVARTWSPLPLSREYGGWSAYTVAGAVFGVPFLLLVVRGLFVPAREGGLPPRFRLLLLTPALYFTAVHALSVGSLRYRVPVEPLLGVVAAGATARRKMPAEVRAVRP